MTYIINLIPIDSGREIATRIHQLVGAVFPNPAQASFVLLVIFSVGYYLFASNIKNLGIKPTETIPPQQEDPLSKFDLYGLLMKSV